MNIRKFTYIITIVVGLFLFFLGNVFLFYINNADPDNTGSPLTGILDGLNGAAKSKPMNFLLLVGDNTGNTDAIMVVNYNPSTNKISMVTIPRDTNVTLKNKILPKINAAYAAGGRKHEGAVYAAGKVSELIGVDINYYVHINLSAIKKITDMLDGVYFDIPADLKYSDPTQDLYIDLKKGYQLLDGDKVEQFLRFRKPGNGKYTPELLKYYDGSDIKRTEMQVKFIKAFISQKLNIQYLSKYNSVINYTFKNIITNMTLTDALKLASGVINIKSNDFHPFRIDGEDKLINGGWFYIYNGKIMDIETKESRPASEIVEEYFYSTGGIATPSGESYVPGPSDGDESKPSQSTKKPSPATKTQNPSNTETDTKAPGGDRP